MRINDVNFRSLMGCRVTYVNKPKNKMAAVAPKLKIKIKNICLNTTPPIKAIHLKKYKVSASS